MIPGQSNDGVRQAESEGHGNQDEDEKKGEWPERDDTDEEALDPVAAGSSASAALDERTSAAAASAGGEGGTMAAETIGQEVSLVSPISAGDVDDTTAGLLTSIPTRHGVSGSISTRRPSRPSNLDLSAATQFGVVGVGTGQANGLPIVASPAPTLSTMRQALSFTSSGSGGGSMRPPVLAPRSPRASTSLSLHGAEDGGNVAGTDTPQNEVGSDYISFAQAIQESRVTPPPPTLPTPTSSSSTARVLRTRPSSVIIAAQPAGPSSFRAITTNVTPSLGSVPNGDAAEKEKKKKRRFSMMGFGKPAAALTPKATPLHHGSSISRLAGASASTPNLVEAAGQSSISASHASSRPPVPPLPIGQIPNGIFLPVPPVRSPSLTSPHSSSLGRPRAQPSLQTVDRIFQPQVTPNDPPISPLKSRIGSSSAAAAAAHVAGSTSSTAGPTQPPPARASRGFFPKLLAGFTRDDRRSNNLTSPNHRVPSEVEKRLAAGGATSATAGWAASGVEASSASGETLGAPNSSSIMQAPAPKLEYVKLPGTKGAIAVKAVETAKKSFLAILCGDAGEKIELFAGTYRTALGLSRTFILPDSPRSVELQLQGDDLVELFLVFGQNIFGLEPATVRVREVRIGRAERRAARRRAREVRGLAQDGGHDAAPLMEDVPQTGETVVMTIARGAGEVSIPVERPGHPSRSRSGRSLSIPNGEGITGPRLEGDLANGGGDGTQTPTTPGATAVATTVSSHGLNPEEIAALAAAAQFGPYTTFQQLSHAPSFPLGVIADDCIIPPTYKDFIQYRERHEQDATPIGELLAAAATPSTLGPSVPPPPPLAPLRPPAPEKWFYIDPKGITRGPWKANLMQTWFKDGFLPPNLPSQRAVIVALRQGGIEAVDVGDALFYPGDESRSSLPHFHANPSGISRRPTFVWKLGSSWQVQPGAVEESKHKRQITLTTSKKPGVISQKTPGKPDAHGVDDLEGCAEEEIVFLGRHRDTVYFCERSAESFRIFSLCTPI
ncbi:hypothetical protein FRB97_002224 [Tulasnella sp. 331]|nr:hypothetical protein FRB97_002224 [Tulasnella sp. 331]